MMMMMMLMVVVVVMMVMVMVMVVVVVMMMMMVLAWFLLWFVGASVLVPWGCRHWMEVEPLQLRFPWRSPAARCSCRNDSSWDSAQRCHRVWI